MKKLLLVYLGLIGPSLAHGVEKSVEPTALPSTPPPLRFGYSIAPHSNVSSGGRGPYTEMSLKELRRRFTRPYQYKDRFARANALSAILDRKFVRRGMTKTEVIAILGQPDNQHKPPDSPPYWTYHDLIGDFQIEFNDQRRVAKIAWSFEWQPGGSVPDYSREY